MLFRSVNTKMIEDLLVTFRSAIINKNQKKAIFLSAIRSSESYTLEAINESYCTDEFKISSHMWRKAGKWYLQYGSCGDIGDEIVYEESHKKFDSARYTYTHLFLYNYIDYACYVNIFSKIQKLF